MLDVKIVDVARKIKEGDAQCEADQKAIADELKAQARKTRLAYRQVWAAKRKNLKLLLDVLQDDEK